MRTLEQGLLNLADMFLLNKLKFLHKIFYNNLPSYFQTYWEHFTQLVVNCNLRSRILPVLRIYHVYAESLFVYQLVKIFVCVFVFVNHGHNQDLARRGDFFLKDFKICMSQSNMCCHLLGELESMLHLDLYLKWCNLVCFGV